MAREKELEKASKVVSIAKSASGKTKEGKKEFDRNAWGIKDDE